MPEFIWKWRREIIFTLLFILSLGMLVSQRQPGFFYRTLHQGVALIIVPCQRGSMLVAQRTRHLIQFLGSVQKLHKQNQSLIQQVEKLTLENRLLLQKAQENEILQRQLEYKQEVPWQFLPAEIISRDPSSWLERAIVNRGSRDGVRVGAGVVRPEGVAGRIIETTLYSATVMFLPDSQSSVAGWVERSKVAGTLKSMGEGRLKLMYVAIEDDVKTGDLVTTSRLSSLFPPGLPLGEIVSVTASENGMMLDIQIKPRVVFKTLDRVLIIKGEE